jgi:hypothetical protein
LLHTCTCANSLNYVGLMCELVADTFIYASLVL